MRATKDKRERERERETRSLPRAMYYDGEYSASVMYDAIGRSTHRMGEEGERDTSLLDPPNN